MIYVHENVEREDISHIQLLCLNQWRANIYRVASFLSLGIVPLLFFWFERLDILLYDQVTQYAEASHALVVNHKGVAKAICKLKHDSLLLLPHECKKDRYYFTHMFNTYFISKKHNAIKSVKNRLLSKLKKNDKLISKYQKAIDDETAGDLQKAYGPNVIDIPPEPLLRLILRELFAPFTMFQIAAIIVWMLDNYGEYAILIGVMMAGSSFMNIREIQIQNKKIHKMTYCNFPATVIRKKSSLTSTDKLSARIDESEVKKRILKSRESLKESLLQAKSSDILDIVEQDHHISLTNDLKAKITSSLQLSVGDVMPIDSSQLILADFLLIQGKCLVDESVLTGETVPILKGGYDPSMPLSSFSIINAGTKCLSSKGAIGVVISTGFYTKKGEMVRALLFAEGSEFKFKRDSYIFIFYIFLATLVLFFWFVYFIALGSYREYYNIMSLIIKGLEMFTISIPPALPLCLTIGLQFASNRLQETNIFTTVMDKINMAGRVSIMCFDKTGTLTETSLKLFGILPSFKMDGTRMVKKFQFFEETEMSDGTDVHPKIDFSHIHKKLDSLLGDDKISVEERERLAQAIGCCHGLSLLDGEVVGDQMEVELFNATGFELGEFNENVVISGQVKMDVLRSNQEIQAVPSEFRLTLVKKIEFTSERKRMTVICKNEATNKLTVFTKGAPEILRHHCQSWSIPVNFVRLLDEYSKQGLRILAIASKEVQSIHGSVEDLESDLTFLGLLLFQNPLKATTRSTIRTLNECRVKTKMITGDNLLTAISVGFESGMISPSKRLFIAHVEFGKILWNEIESEEERRSARVSIYDHELSGVIDISHLGSIQTVSAFNNVHENCKDFLQYLVERCQAGQAEIGMTGEAFSALLLNRDLNNYIYRIILENSVIFGRTDPEQKAQIVSSLQRMQKITHHENWLIGFCGDGANDCAALRQADVGLSIAQTEASIAAPFNTTVTEISPIIDLFLEGKSSLETALQNFKFILYYSFLQFYGLIAGYSRAFEFSSGHYYYMDLICFLPLSIFLSSNASADRLNRYFPKSSLLNFEVVTGIVGHLILSGFGMIILTLLVYSYPGNLKVYESTPSLDIEANENYIPDSNSFFCFGILLISVGALIFSRGFPFKQPFYKNKWLTFYAVFSFALSLVITYADHLPLPYSLKYLNNVLIRQLTYELPYIHLYVTFTLLFGVLAYLFEKKFLKWLHEWMKLRRRNKKPQAKPLNLSIKSKFVSQ